MNNRCHEILPLISAKLDGELDQPDNAVVQRHLESCPDCRQRLAQWEYIDQILAATAITPSDTQLDRIRVVIHERNPERLFRRIVGMSVAAVLLVAFALTWAMRPQQVAARTIAEPFVKLHRIQRAQDLAQSSTLQTLEWELRALKLELDSSSMAQDQKSALLARISQLLQRLQQMQQNQPDSFQQGT